MELETVYNMAAAAARGAERMRAARKAGQGMACPSENYAGYPYYIDKYNQLRAYAAEIDPEITAYFPVVDIGART